MKTLHEKDIIRLMKEEWSSKIAKLSEEVDITLKTKVDGKVKNVLSPDLKIRHKKSQILYTVVSIGPQDIILKTPEGEDFLIDNEKLEDEYELD